MNLEVIKQVATRTFGRTSVIMQKHSPAILTGVGIAGTIGTTILASRATLKLEKHVTDLQENLELANSLPEEELRLKLKTAAYTKGVVSIVKLYGPAVTLGVASIGCLIGAQSLLHKRNVALAAAYKTVESSFGQYRKRVVEKLGGDQDLEFLRGKPELVKIKDEETGEEKEYESHSDPSDLSMYSKFFDEFNPNWARNAEYNLVFLRAQQNYANDLLKSRGHLFLNEVYDMLGLERTQAGAVVGWVLAKGNDNYVDFGIYDGGREMARRFVNGEEAAIRLDFNVDGTMFDKI